MAASSDGAQGPLRFFSGDTEDGKEYRRWKVWVQNKMLTMDKLTSKAQGAYVYTLLSGKALDAVEHLKPSEYHGEDGAAVIFKILDGRFPQLETTDEMAEVLSEIFSLSS